MNLTRITQTGLAVLAAATLAGTPAAGQKAAEKPAAPAKSEISKKTAPSPCKGLSQSACSANKECGWVTPKKKVASNGRKLTAYCRKVAVSAPKPK